MPRPINETADAEHLVATLHASLELSQSTWVVTSLLPGSKTMSKHSVRAGDGSGLLALLARLRTKAEAIAGAPIEIVVIQEAGLDGFWVHRLLEANGIESHVVDAASIAVPRRRRRSLARRQGPRAGIEVTPPGWTPRGRAHRDLVRRSTMRPRSRPRPSCPHARRGGPTPAARRTAADRCGRRRGRRGRPRSRRPACGR